MTEVMIKNVVKCNKCEDIIESKHRHDFKWCKCGSVAVDGGLEYQRLVGDIRNATDLSVYTDGDGAA